MRLWKRRPIQEFEEVDHEPLTVLEILREMKDLSELMTSLAYSALILDNDPISEEVEAMATRMDWLKYQLRQAASLGVRSIDEAEQMSGVLQIGDASEHIANAATDMIEILDAKVATRPFLRRVLDEADDRITTLQIPDGSRAVGSTLGDLELESKTGVRALAIRRGKRWVYDPDRADKLRAGDLIVARGQREGAEHVRRWLAGQEAAL